jgi:hypothetical protein
MKAKTRQDGRIYLVMQQTVRLLFFSFAVLVASLAAQIGSPVPTVETIVDRMGQARDENQSRSRPYIVTRDYTLFGQERQKSKSHVIAQVTFVPRDQKQYAIQESKGSGLGEKIVRRMLAGEADITKDLTAAPVPVRFAEGLTHGFLVLRTLNRVLIA